jgi:hypothetical protein
MERRPYFRKPKEVAPLIFVVLTMKKWSVKEVLFDIQEQYIYVLF